MRPSTRLTSVIVGSVPIVLLGIFLKDTIEDSFRNLWLIATMLIVMGLVLLGVINAVWMQPVMGWTFALIDGVLSPLHFLLK